MANPFKVLSRIFKGKRGKRGYSELSASRLLSDWVLNDDDGNKRISQHLGHVRRMCRDLAETNKYAQRYLDLRVTNVVGPDGFKLQSRVMDKARVSDDYARRIIEEKWAKWKAPQLCTPSGNQHHNDVDRLQERSLGVDGEVFIVVYPGFDNKHRFAIRTLEPDFISHDLNIELKNGNRIVMGKEITQQNKCVAYWLNGEHPGGMFKQYAGANRSRVPALSSFLDEVPGIPSKSGYILHQFTPRRPDQQRGISDLVACIESLRHLDRTEESHHVAARLASCAVFQRVDENADEWDYEESERFADQMQITPGFALKSGLGRKWEILQPQFPNTALPDHAKQTLQSCASSLGVSYAGLSGDLEGTSYSSGRLGSLSERDGWKTKQDEAINGRVRPIFEAWLRTQLMFNQLGGLKLEEEQRYRASHFQPRRWDWIDPQRDSAGKKSDLGMKLTSPQRVLAERGLDPEEVLNEWAEYEQMMQAKGLEMPEFKAETIATEKTPLSNITKNGKLINNGH